jgi:outer membrane protein OmpA-like peptidoglycan-associated protein
MTRGVARLTGAIATSLLLAACAETRDVQTAPARDDVFVVVPDPNGRAGKVVVVQDGKEIVLDGPYAAARTGAGGRLERGAFTATDADKLFAPALAAQPPAPLAVRLYFVEGREEFTPDSAQALRSVLDEIKRRPAPEVLVVGHTDRVGTAPANDRLSLQRAERVRQELIRIGIPAASITVAGRGEREPLVPTGDQVPEPRNRRVEITVR